MTRGVLVLGEVLMDLFPPRAGVPIARAPALTLHLGGAPANVAVQLARLGVDVALVSAVGADPFGERCLRVLRKEGVDVTAVPVRPSHRTGATLVELDARGERRFSPLGDRRADLSLHPDDVDARLVSRFAAVHTGTVGLRERWPRAAHRRLAACAHAAGAIVSLDVNLRWGMYPDRSSLLRLATSAVRRAHVVKATRDEARALLQLGPRADDERLVDGLLRLGPRLALLTLDAEGARIGTRRAQVCVAAPRVRVRDATGAGDAFIGAALAYLVGAGIESRSLDALGSEDLARLGARACAAGSAACTALGATTSMVRATNAFRRPKKRRGS